MTSTITLPDVETIEHLDWKSACEFKSCNYGRPPATHIAYFPCGCQPLGCTPDVEKLHRLILEAIRWYDDWGTCGSCWKTMTASEIRVEPLL